MLSNLAHSGSKGVYSFDTWAWSGKPYGTGWFSTVDLLVLTSSEQLLFVLKLHFSFFAKQPMPNEEVNCTEPFLSVRVPWLGTYFQKYRGVEEDMETERKRQRGRERDRGREEDAILMEQRVF
jgi:hypothetical protein